MVARLLTDRQLVYLRHYCAGKSHREIAAAMGIQPTSLGHNHSAIKARLGVSSMTEACRRLSGQPPSADDSESDADRTTEAMRLRRQGFTYERIGRLLAINRVTARDRVARGVAKWHRRNRLPVPPDLSLDELLERIPEEHIAAL